MTTKDLSDFKKSAVQTALDKVREQDPVLSAQLAVIVGEGKDRQVQEILSNTGYLNEPEA